MTDLKKEIERKLLQLVKIVNIKNKMNLNDINMEWENCFAIY